MSTFYLLPPRQELSRRFADYLNKVFPGLDWNDDADLVGILEDLAESHNDVIVVYRDDIPEGQEFDDVLVDNFGAEEDDLIVEVPDDLVTAEEPRIWRLSA